MVYFVIDLPQKIDCTFISNILLKSFFSKAGGGLFAKVIGMPNLKWTSYRMDEKYISVSFSYKVWLYWQHYLNFSPSPYLCGLWESSLLWKYLPKEPSYIEGVVRCFSHNQSVSSSKMIMQAKNHLKNSKFNSWQYDNQCFAISPIFIS